MDKKKIAGVIAATAAIAFVTAPLTSAFAHTSAKIKCYGVNKCKGKSACKTAQGSCKGKNSCKGKGYLMKTEAQCKKMHGKMKETSKTEPSKTEPSQTPAT